MDFYPVLEHIKLEKREVCEIRTHSDQHKGKKRRSGHELSLDFHNLIFSILEESSMALPLYISLVIHYPTNFHLHYVVFAMNPMLGHVTKLNSKRWSYKGLFKITGQNHQIVI